MLLAASCIFYMFFIPKYILILFLTIIVDYFAGILIEKNPQHKKSLLVISIITNVGILMFFKYFNFFATNFNELSDKLNWNYSVSLLEIILPIGLSFHTFQAMSYTIEVYRGNQRAEKHFGIYALYVMYYPQLVAGPIERPQNVLHQFHEEHKFNFNLLQRGLVLMLWGFFKKVVIADRIAYFVNPVFEDPHSYEGISLCVAAVLFSFQIFCDFSGYCDIGIGASQVMGIKLMNNFNRPYSAKSISDFWSRWHISLSTWFRDYLYIPLGGNRVPKIKWYRNIVIVFLISGFWHGANWTFIIWGGLHAFYQLFGLATNDLREKLRQAFGITKMKWLNSFSQVFTTFILVTIAWVFFRADTVSNAVYMIKSGIVGIPNYVEKVLTEKDYLWLEPLVLRSNYKVELFDLVVLLVSIMILEIVHHIKGEENIGNRLLQKPVLIRWSVYSFFIFFILFFGAFHNSAEFIYFQF